jgi:PAS domain S-box-containing protein
VIGDFVPRSVDEPDADVRRALDRIADGFLACDHGFRILFVNRSAERYFGRPRAELLGRVVWEIFPQSQASEMRRRIREAAAAGEPTEVEVRSPETQRWVALRVFADADGISVFLHDVTDARHVADELRTSEARHRAVFQHALDGMFWTAPTGEIFAANEAACRMFGRTEAEIRSVGRAGLIDSSDPRLAAALADRREHGHLRAELTGVRKDGSKFPIEVASAIYVDADGRERTSMIVRDLSEQKRSLERLQTIADAGAVLGSILDSKETVAQLTRLVVPRMADCCAVELVEGGVLRRVAASHREREEECAIPTRAVGDERPATARMTAPRTAIFVPMIASDKLVGVLSLGLSASRRTYEDDDLAAACAIADRAALAIDNARLHEQTTEAKRLRDEVVGVVSHDLRSPLNTVLVGARLLTQEIDSPVVASVLRAAKYASTLIRDLLSVTAIEAGSLPLERTRESIGSIVDEAVSLHHEQAVSQSITVETHVEPDLPAVSVDRLRVLQVLGNLLDNAFKFTPEGGRVLVEARRRERDVIVRVADTGCGIPAESLPHVFDRFWQGTRAHRAGAGLGLAIAKGIVDAHGGHIDVASEEGRGTTFTFTLPAA